MKKRTPHRRGVALVIVLASLILLTALVLAFLASVGSELRSSKAYSAGSSAKLLAQSSVNLAMAQIRDATSGTNSGGGVVAWASQPGMIRTYDSSGNPANYYKLYSWTDMTGGGVYDPTASSNSIPSDWSKYKAVYTDLNQPLSIPDGATNRLVYPIVDGNGLVSTSGGAKTYMTNGAPAVDGFSIDSSAPVDASATAPNPVPMPVKWLYVLENGKIVAPTQGGAAYQAAVPGASATNQIVGRVAFWTDDESCKVNVNTASEGTYADMPRGGIFNGSQEITLAKNQPVQAEYQRYPGHPATTSLSTVLKKPGSGVTDDAWAETIYDIVPRVKTGGSREGSVATAMGSTSLAITPDADRLYASIDELIFKPTSSSSGRDANAASLNKDTLPRDRFFLTPFSRSPDVNLFNQPRVSIWPIYKQDSSADAAYLTAFDKLMAFCTKINGYLYSFQRQNPDDPRNDLPANGGTTGLARNRTLIEYLRTTAGKNIPGFGGSFRAKYGSDTDQILTEIFDYIRSTNLADNTLTDATKRFTKARSGSNSPNFPGLGQVVPIEDSKTSTRGFGRFRTVQGASLVFIANIDGDVPDSQRDQSGNLITDATLQVKPGYVRLQAMFLLQLFDPSVGSIFDNPYFKWSVTGLDSLKWGPLAGPPVAMSFNGGSTTYLQDRYPIDGAYYGDQMGINQLLNVAWGKYISASIDVPKSGGKFRFEGGTIEVKLMTGSNAVVQTVKLDLPSANLPLPELGPLTVNTQDPSFNPKATHFRYFADRLSHGAGADRDRGGAWIMDRNGGDGSGGFDVVRSVGPVAGDVRLIAAQSTVASSSFAPIGDWESTAGAMGMHTLRSGSGEPVYGARIGALVSGLNYESNIQNGGFSKNSINDRNYQGIVTSAGPDAPFDGVAVGKSTAYASGDLIGDFDNAPGIIRDGPFINKADEGAQGFSSKTPYDWSRGQQGAYMQNPTLFTPNRLIPSAVMFGSLPTGVLANRPWQTLLFHYDPTGLHPGNKGRTGAGAASASMPADHLLLDLFTMPVVEPYAISEPLSTAGRLNMNYQILPFTYINRDTGIRSVLKGEKVIGISDTDVQTYKSRSGTLGSIRYDIDADETLKGFQKRFDGKDIFRSATEICDLPIVPVGATYNDVTSSNGTFWKTRRLTGDNSKERPYATIYPRLTTKSNTFTIYYRVESLKQAPGSDPGVWNDNKDQVIGELRGSQTIERFVDPANTSIPDYAGNSSAAPLSEFYKFRILQSKQFSP